MKLPPLLLGAAAGFWGWQSGNYVLAALLVLLLEAHRATGLRFAFGATEFRRIASVSTIGFVGLIGWLLAASGGAVGPPIVLTAFLWLPVVFAPVMLAQLYSVDGRIPLSALFRYLRRMKERDPSTHDPMVDLRAPYVAICIIAAGTLSARGLGYYAGAVLLGAWGLFAVRPRHASFAAWIIVLALAGAAGYGIQAGLLQAQAALGDWVGEWHLRGVAGDPYRSTTDLGAVGRLKQFDTIVMRIYAPPAQAERLRLLHRASFNTLVGSTWRARNAPMTGLDPQADGATWILAAGTPGWSARLVTRLESGKALLALPAGIVRVSGAPANSWRRNVLGASQADLGGDWGQYTVEAADRIQDYAEPNTDDRGIPAAERAALEEIAAELKLGELSAGEALRRVREHLATFSYSTYREAAVPAGSTALGDFLRRTKSGHCEYFAAATTLLLRTTGIPARYATGYAVLEHSTLENAYLVRARHAHAWSRAWIDGQWIDVDTTPPSWFDEEADQAPFWQGAADLLRWAGFRWSQRGELRIGMTGCALIALLSVVLAWRLLKGRRAATGTRKISHTSLLPGADSEFYAVERALSRKGLAREPCESLASWIESNGLRPQLDAALSLHYRYRFDPQGLSAAERGKLRSACLAIIGQWERS